MKGVLLSVRHAQLLLTLNIPDDIKEEIERDLEADTDYDYVERCYFCNRRLTSICPVCDK